MVKTKEEWENNLKEFEKMLEDNKKNIEMAEKNIEDVEFFMASIKDKISKM
jgi:ABC-type Zn2+ transport system substrate-binding protein/surface adhesin